MDINYTENNYKISIEGNLFGSNIVVGLIVLPIDGVENKKDIRTPWNEGKEGIKPITLITSYKKMVLVNVNVDGLFEVGVVISNFVGTVEEVQINGNEEPVKKGIWTTDYSV